MVDYSATFWWDNTWVNQLFQSSGEENFSKFTTVYSVTLQLVNWLGKALANDIHFAKVFPARILHYFML